MVRPEVIRRRLDQLGRYLEILDHYRGYDLASFTSDPERYGSAERFLQLAIEATLDVGTHIVADAEGFSRLLKNKKLKEVFGGLQEEGKLIRPV